MWVYRITTGELTDPEGHFAGNGYSGATGSFRNNPTKVGVHQLGPIPPGKYTISEPYDEIPGTGPCTMALTPSPDTNTLGRSLFRIHGDNLRHDASHGCIILGPAIRHQIAASGDRDLEVLV